ncbi:uncharacterized protein BX663DRAFT_514215 [Cokeromyces recurvatus]|uniref:uncharacterized protein n=1 Tax=Cokeromyces recurvatus TaxID=90255 RepID=UPI0022209CB1|nr:uncharacterized protein BX663DRAFT_514215 [Cokeromyces recurvatus]KAI7901361.1 hypothetical protein BX663DRAFT_514215 [Cokeromyces recurvatus]
MTKNITREQFLKRMESFEDVDVCYDNNPMQPMLLCNERIDSEPLKYKRYSISPVLIENSLIQ